MSPSGSDLDLSASTRLSGQVSPAPSTTELLVPVLTVLAHPERRRIGERAPLPELFSGASVALSRAEPLFSQPGSEISAPLADNHLSRKPLQLRQDSATGDITVDRGQTSTVVRLDGSVLENLDVVKARQLARGVTLELGRHLALLLHLGPALDVQRPHFGLIGDSAAALDLYRDIDLATRTEASVLLRGGSGTGKELVARAIHDAGPRRNKPWVAVNMAAIAPQIAASELFGAKRGAFTGASQDRPGFFRAAHGGTLFLDEIGDTPADLQPLLLRALESGEIQPVGDTVTRRVDVRVIAATDANLDDAVAEQRFRAPLMHRLAGWEIRLPTLAQRRSDIGRLLAHFLSAELKAHDPWPQAPVFARLARYDWPGNVRQLVNVARRLAIMLQAGQDQDIDRALDTLLTPAPSSAGEASGDELGPIQPPPAVRSYRKASDIDRDQLTEALREAEWNLKPAAQSLGVSRSLLYKLIERHRIPTAKDLPAEAIRNALDEHHGDAVAASRALEVSFLGLKIRMKALGLGPP